MRLERLMEEPLGAAMLDKTILVQEATAAEIWEYAVQKHGLLVAAEVVVVNVVRVVAEVDVVEVVDWGVVVDAAAVAVAVDLLVVPEEVVVVVDVLAVVAEVLLVLALGVHLEPGVLIFRSLGSR